MRARGSHSCYTRVSRTELCRFSGLKIYPGKGMTYVRADSQKFIFLNRKIKSLYNQRKKPSKIAWTFQYRKAHKKDQVETSARRKRRGVIKSAARPIGAVSMEVIQKKRSEKTEVRQASRDAALREIKERNKKLQEQRKANAAARAKAGGGAKAPPVAKKGMGKR